MKTVTNCYQFLDKNHDGVVDFKEFYRLYKTICDMSED